MAIRVFRLRCGASRPSWLALYAAVIAVALAASVLVLRAPWAQAMCTVERQGPEGARWPWCW